jgi:hypothetical protein
VRIALFHAWLLATLLAAVLIRIDGQRLPANLVLASLAIGLAAPLVWPDLRPLAAWPAWTELRSPSRWYFSLVEGLAGIAAGGLAGAVLAWGNRFTASAERPRVSTVASRLPPDSSPPAQNGPQAADAPASQAETTATGRRNPDELRCESETSGRIAHDFRYEGPAMAALVGVFLGWQAALGAVLICGLLLVARAILSCIWPWAGRVPPAALLLVAVMAHIAFWKPLAGWTIWLGQ